MLYKLGYGHGSMPVDIPEKNLAGVLLPEGDYANTDESAEIRRALESPIGSPRLRDIVRPHERVAIVTSDVTRPMPTARVMDAVLDELYSAGIDRDDITLVFAIGSHRPHTPMEREALSGARAWREIRCVDSDPLDCVHMGTTSAGTPVDITRAVAEADRRICLGNIEFHYFAGYSGGAKAIMPGVSTRAAIQHNHSRMTHPNAAAGRLEDNPIRRDIEEAGSICGIDFILNVVLDDRKRIVKAVAGDPTLSHREGCRFLDGLCGKAIERRVDIVVVSPGGAPKDINLYQTQKALDNARHAVRDGGIIILVGACGEGFGEAVFERWLNEADTPEQLTRRIESDFQLGGHKAAAIAMVLKRASVFFVSEMPPELARKAFLEPFASAQQALDEALIRLGNDATVLLMPYGGSILPLLK